MKDVLASYCICNTASLNIYDFEFGIDDYVEVGLNDYETEMCKLNGDKFFWGETEFDLSEFIGV